MLVCLNCWETKSDCRCSQNQYVEIDDNIYPAIKKLNLLGYKTKFCCEGHNDEYGIQAYIVFDCNKDNKMFDSLPEGWYYESYNYKKVKHYKYNIIRSIVPSKRTFETMNDKQRQDIIDTNIFNLIQWCDKLEKG